jgi:hypothetical protein
MKFSREVRNGIGSLPGTNLIGVLKGITSLNIPITPVTRKGVKDCLKDPRLGME